MLAYVWILLSPLLLLTKQSNRIFSYIIVINGFLLCTTYYNGSDWRGYERIFLDNTIVEYWEPGFNIIFNLARHLSNDFVVTLIAFKVFIYVATIFIIFQLLGVNQKKVYILFMVTTGIGLFIDNPLRQFAALPIFMISYIAFCKDNKYWIALVFLGSFIHFSTIFLLFFVILRNRSTLFVCTIIMISAIIIIQKPDLVLNLLLLVSPFEFLNNLDWYLRWYLTELEFRLGLSSYLYSLLLALYIFLADFKKVLDRKFAAVGSLFFVVGILGSTIEELARLNYFFWFPMAISIAPILFDRFVHSIFYLFAVVLNLNIILTDYRYLPYTNYVFQYPFTGPIPYWVRSKIHHDYHKYTK